MKGKTAFFFIFCFFIFAGNSFAGDIESRLNALEETIKQQGETIKEQQRVISELKEQLRGPKEGLAKAEEQAAVGLASQKATGLFGSSALTNPNISVVLNTFGYTSNL